MKHNKLNLLTLISLLSFSVISCKSVNNISFSENSSSISVSDGESTSEISESKSDTSSVEISEEQSNSSIIESSSVEQTEYSVTINGGSGSGTYKDGETVTIVANDSEDGPFVGWKVDGEIISTENPYVFVASKDLTITACYDNPFAKYVKTVKKKANEDFKILNLTDIQLHDGESTDIFFSVIDELVEKEKPSMITFLGDLLNDDRTYASIVNAQAIINKINSYNIPWAPIFGNHDYETYSPGYNSKKTTTSTQLATWYKNSSNCLYTDGPSFVTGKSNYVVNVVDEFTKEPIESLIFTDSTLSGFDDTIIEFYDKAIEYTTKQNNNNVVPSVLFTHIAMAQYVEPYEYSKLCDYQNIVGCLNRNPCDLATGNTELFSEFKKYDSTKLVVCGHDHENAYYSYKDGIQLAYSMKSSNGDHYDNFAQIGGSIVSITDEGQDFYYTKATIQTNISGTESDKGQHTICPDTLPFWKFSGAKLVFDISMPDSGSLTLSLCGTNQTRPGADEKTRYGSWNRLADYIKFNASNKTVNYGTLENIEGNLYRYTLDFENVALNLGDGEKTCGDETLRLLYFSNAIGTFGLNNYHYEFKETTGTNQIDLENAVIAEVNDMIYYNMMIKPKPTVTLNNKELVFGKDIVYTYENNYKQGTATITIIPSASGANYYKGSKSINFNIIENPDVGHENAMIIDEDYTLNQAYKNFVVLNDWYNSNKKLHMEFKRLNEGTTSGETAKFALFGTNSNEGITLPATSDWNRLTANYTIDFSNGKLSIYTDKNNPIASVSESDNGWFIVEIPFSSFELNSSEGAKGNANETLSLCYIFSVTRSFKLDNVQLVD